MKMLKVHGGGQAILDDDDYAVASALGPWNVHKRGGKSPEKYVRRGFTTTGREKVAVMLHHIVAHIMGLNVNKAIGFANNNTFDLRRQNLVERPGPERTDRRTNIQSILSAYLEGGAPETLFRRIKNSLPVAPELPPLPIKKVWDVLDWGGRVKQRFGYFEKEAAMAYATQIGGFIQPGKILLDKRE